MGKKVLDGVYFHLNKKEMSTFSSMCANRQFFAISRSLVLRSSAYNGKIKSSPATVNISSMFIIHLLSCLLREP